MQLQHWRIFLEIINTIQKYKPVKSEMEMQIKVKNAKLGQEPTRLIIDAGIVLWIGIW